ncbi:unnamed protein product [Ilex paraguariensis]|uniref:Uncharacterized protein n=1 Tax=Ilex paraguariensis TaxID=185542 RepID=A0ABC8STG3_9AQUA
MLSVSPSSMVRSSLEEMLDNLRRRDEKPKDLPPDLPSRPRPTSRARLPRAKRSLPTNFEIDDAEPPEGSAGCDSKREEVKRSRICSFGAEKFKEVLPSESPYAMTSEERKCGQRLEEQDGMTLTPASSGSLPRFQEPEVDDNVGYFSKKIGALEDTRKQVLQGTLEVQKHFRGHRARHYFHELKKGVITLQSFVRGENTRREYDVLIRSREQVAWKMLDENLCTVVRLQSVIRGWLVRRHFSHLQHRKEFHCDALNSIGNPGKKFSEVKNLPQEYVHVLLSDMEELQRRVMQAEATLSQKEEENAALRAQLQHFQARWSEYEAKMKSMEEMWQKQMTSLQMSLAAAKKITAADNTAGQPGRLVESSPSPHCYDSEDNMSMRTQTPGGNTPIKFVNGGLDFGARRRTNSAFNAFSHLVKEFEQGKQIFDDEAKAIVEVKSGQVPSINPDEELRKLQHKFEAWKKEYKVKLRNTKAKFSKLGHSEVGKSSRKWWGRKSKRC